MVNGIHNVPEVDPVWVENIQLSIIPEVLNAECYTDCYDIYGG